MLCLIPFLSFSQYEKDSLEIKWKDQNLSAVKRIEALSKLINFYLPQHPDSIISLGKQAYELTRKENLKEQQVNALLIIGVAYHYKKEFSRSLLYYDSAMKVSIQMKDRNQIARIYRNLGILYYDQGYFKKSLQYFRNCLKYADPKSGLYNMALQHIGNSYYKIQNYEMAAQYFQECIDHALKIKERDKLATYYAGLADILIHIGKLQQAEEMLKLSREYIMNKEDAFYIEHVFFSLYLNQKKYDLAQKQSEKTLQQTLSLKNSRLIIDSYFNCAKLYSELGQYDKAIYYGELAMRVGEKERIPLDLKEIADLLQQLYEKKGNFKKAFETLKSQSTIKDSINKNVMLQYELSKEFEKKSLKDSLKSAESTKILNLKYRQKLQSQSLYSITGFTAAVLLLIVSVFIYKNYKSKQKINKIISEENKILEVNKELSQNHIRELLGVIDSAIDIIAFSKGGPEFSYINHEGKKMMHLREFSNDQSYSYETIFAPETVDFINTIAIPESNENGFFSGEVTIHLADQTQFPVLLNVVSQKNNENKITQYSMIARDISDLKTYQGKIELQNEQLQKVNSELDHFVYSASHDLRSPLTSISGIVTILSSDFLPDDRDYKLYLEMIVAAIDRTDTVIKSIVEYSKNSRVKLKIERLDVRFFIDKTLKNFAAPLQHNNIKVIVDVDQKFPFYSDKMRFEILLSNTIGNAIRFQRSEEKHKTITINFNDVAAESTLTIEDNGVGIKEKHFDKVFKMFFRGSNLSSGSGLGLYIVKQITGLLNSQVILESEFGKGTKLLIIFPRLNKP